MGRDCRQSRCHRLIQFPILEYGLRNIHFGYIRHICYSLPLLVACGSTRSHFTIDTTRWSLAKQHSGLLVRLFQQLPNPLFSVRGYAKTWRHSRAINSLCNYGGIDMGRLLPQDCVATRALFTFVRDFFEFHSLPSSSDMAHLYIHVSEQSRQDVVLSQV
jgi:hypothetical protein